MKISIKDIPSQGLELSKIIEAGSLGLLPQEIKCCSPLKIFVSVNRVDNTVLAHTEVQGRYSDLCARCLEEVENDLAQKFDIDYTIEGGMEIIDLGEDIRQEMISNYPTRILCKDECKGICPLCGVNLNKEKCKCK